MEQKHPYHNIAAVFSCDSVFTATSRIVASFVIVIMTTSLLASGSVSAQSSGEIQLNAVLSDTQEVPPVAVSSRATGTATLTVNTSQTEIAYSLNLNGPFSGAPTQAHIHVGPVGAAGPPVFFLCATNTTEPVPAPQGTQPCPGVQGGPLTGSLTASNLVPQGSASITTFAEAINAVLSGNTYINVHTPNNGPGETRGQIGPVKFKAMLDSAQEVPPVQTPTNATGTADVSLNATQTEITYTIQLNGPFTGAPTQAHIHVGAAGSQGPVIFFNCATNANVPVPAPSGTQPCPGATGGMVSGTLTEDNLVSQPNAGITSFGNAVNALISTNTYINVHTTANGDGEIRGQNNPATVSFSRQIQPIFTQNCAFSGCHAGMSPPAGLNLAAEQAHGNLVGVPSSQMPMMNRVKPFDPNSSYLFKKHSGDSDISGVRMPQNNPDFFVENPDLLELERRWIEQGAQNN